MGELTAGIDSSPAWVPIVWCFYPMIVISAFQILSDSFDDNDHNSGTMIPVSHGS